MPNVLVSHMPKGAHGEAIAQATEAIIAEVRSRFPSLNIELDSGSSLTGGPALLRVTQKQAGPADSSWSPPDTIPEAWLLAWGRYHNAEPLSEEEREGVRLLSKTLLSYAMEKWENQLRILDCEDPRDIKIFCGVRFCDQHIVPDQVFALGLRLTHVNMALTGRALLQSKAFTLNFSVRPNGRSISVEDRSGEVLLQWVEEDPLAWLTRR